MILASNFLFLLEMKAGSFAKHTLRFTFFAGFTTIGMLEESEL
jgi:hypothetical protein